MKTQISHLRSGKKSQKLNPDVDYSTLPKATNHSGYAGSPVSQWIETFEKVREENPDVLKIKLMGEIIELKAHYSVSGKSVHWYANIDKEFAKKFVPLSKYNSNIIISSAEIAISNGKNYRLNLCPSLIEIL